jgi:glutathione synthase
MRSAAQAADYEFATEQKDLWLSDGVAHRRVRPVQVRDDRNDWYKIGEAQIAKLAELDAFLMRKDPPFDMEFVYTTYILERAEVQGRAGGESYRSGLRGVNEKGLRGVVPAALRAPTLVARATCTDMDAFLARASDEIVCKPLDGMGGRIDLRRRSSGDDRNRRT